jgi:hypothetical protein
VTAEAPAEIAENPAQLLSYLVDRMLTGYEQDDDVTVLVVHVPTAGDAGLAQLPGSPPKKGRA